MGSGEVFVKEASKPNKPDSIVDLVFCIKERPVMYIGDNSLTCLKAFIDGWTFRSYDTITDWDVMADFDTWLRKRYKMQKMEQDYYNIIRFWSTSDDGALRLFFKLFQEFISKREMIRI